jgi:hypothetical protein
MVRRRRRSRREKKDCGIEPGKCEMKHAKHRYKKKKKKEEEEKKKEKKIGRLAKKTLNLYAQNTGMYTVRSKSFRTDFFLKTEDT